MSLSWNTLCDIPRLRDYASASKREAETKPVRGDEYGRKPLGRRDQKYRHIKRLDDNSIGIFEHARDIPHIQFFPNGDIHVVDLATWNKASYNEVLTEVLGLPVHTEKGKAWVRYDGGTAPLRPAPKMRYVAEQGWTRPQTPYTPSVFRMNEQGRLVYINPPPIPTHVVSRKGAKAVRTRYMQALGYIEALVKLRRDDKPSLEEVRQAFPKKFEDAQETLIYAWTFGNYIPAVSDRRFEHKHAIEVAALMHSEDPGDHYRAYLWLQLDTHPSQVMTNAETVLSWAHRDEWFVEREPIAGQKVHDRYAWAFKD
jgi:hypothetical protein